MTHGVWSLFVYLSTVCVDSAVVWTDSVTDLDVLSVLSADVAGCSELVLVSSVC